MMSDFLGIPKEACFSGVPGVPINEKSLNSNISDVDTPEHLVKSGVCQVFHPVPADAPSPPDSHPELGIPSMKSAYHTPQGEVISHVYRFDTTSGKEFRPLSFQNGKWTWKGLPAPRPLYNLHALAKHPRA